MQPSLENVNQMASQLNILYFCLGKIYLVPFINYWLVCRMHVIIHMATIVNAILIQIFEEHNFCCFCVNLSSTNIKFAQVITKFFENIAAKF